MLFLNCIISAIIINFNLFMMNCVIIHRDWVLLTSRFISVIAVT
jgi:hypothetical protein